MDKRKAAKILAYRYTILASVLVLLAGGLLLLPKYAKIEGVKPELLLSSTISPERYISTDMLADKIVGQDPSFILIDVRDAEEYEKYALPNSINIPLANLLDEDNIVYINQEQFDVIFYSNDNFYADQAWMLGSRLGYKNLKVLKGGVNAWFETIINPKKPNENEPETAFNLYANRKAASMYFGVMYPEQYTSNSKPKEAAPAPKKVITVKKKKKAPTEGGC